VIYPYAEEDSYGKNSLGECIFAYFDGFIWTLKNSFIPKHSALGIEELNTVCPKHVITFVPSAKFSYNGSEVVDGKLHIVFHPEKLGTNIGQIGDNLADALSTAPQPEGASTLSYAARYSIKTDYDSSIGALEKKVRDILKNEKIILEPGFEEQGKMLKGSKDARDDWETNLGSFAVKYYEGLLDALEREKFADDEMLREGLEEAVPKGVVKLRLVEKLTNGGYNETVLEDGALIIQTTPEKWGTNIHYSCEKLVDLL